MDDSSQGDICRVCRCEGQPDRQLFHPCICTGSIKWIHQDCLMQWMRYSRKEYCELCGHRFSFTPIYSPDMPRVLPLRDVAGGLLASVGTAVRNWLHYTLVAIAWLGIVPLTAYRTYKFLFSGSLDMILSFDFFSTEHILSDVLRGCVVITCSLLAFIALVWLREQVLHGGGPDWLEREEVNPQPAPAPPAPVPEVADRVIEDNGRNALRNRARGDVPDAPEQVIEDNGRNGFRNQPNDAQGDVIADNVGNALNNQPFRNREREVQNNLPDVIENNIRDEDNLNNDPVIDRDPILERDLIPDDPDPIGEREEPDGEQEAAGENWNPMEWDRGAEELTWERLLGLDGSMVFLEHVFWVVSLNTVFIFIFAFCPYVIGNSLLKYTNYLDEKSLIHFDGILTALFGYCIIAVTFVKLHGIARLLRFKKLKRIFGLCYIYVKVSLLAVVEIGVIPLVCGWWLDICSLPMFDATLKDRKESFKAAPGTSLFIHWMFGVVYVYYFASFIVVLREVLRPGVLWFLRNLNDPDFSPIQGMIHLSILTHVRRLLVSAVIFGTAVLLGIWVPIQILQTIWPSFLPYTLSADSDINEQSLHLLLFQFVLPGFFEQSHSRIWLKGLIRLWCTVVSWILGIKSYLLGLNEQQNVNNARAPEPQQGLGAAHQALLQREVPIGFQPYTKPKFFPIRIFFLIILMSMSLVVASVITLTVPIWIGRQSMTVWSFSSHVVQPTKPDEQPLRPHELYTAALGAYMCWLILRAIMIAANLIPLGRQAIVTKLKQWYTVGASYAMAVVISVLMLGVVPLLFGLLLELVVVIPLRVPLMQTPILFLWQDWALGVLYTKIACALTLMGPDWSLKRAIERAYRDGLRDIDLKFIVRELCAPVIICFGLMLAIPYVIAHTIVPLFITNPTIIAYISRRIYPFFLLIALGTVFLIFQVKQFSKFYIAIKNDKYLVGQRLVNYDHRKKRAEAQAAAAAALAAEADRDN